MTYITYSYECISCGYYFEESGMPKNRQEDVERLLNSPCKKCGDGDNISLTAYYGRWQLPNVPHRDKYGRTWWGYK